MLRAASETIIYKTQFKDTLIRKNSLKILNWNIAKQCSHQQWVSDFKQIIAHHHPDLLFMQEVRLQNCMQTLLGQHQLGWVFAPNLIETFHQSYAGVMTSSYIRPVNSQPLMTKHAEPISNTPKVSLIVEYQFANQLPLLTVNTHAINFVTTKKFRQELQHLELSLMQHQGAIVLAGDFNTWNQQRLEALTAMTHRLKLKAVNFKHREPYGLQRWLGMPPLDHVFYRGITEKEKGAHILHQIDSSDHKPMIVEFNV